MIFNNSIRFIHNSILFKSISTQTVRVRFAPSPTGFLHLGGLRTALYNYLFAQQKHGKFVLRIEDTDQTRLVPGATEQLLNDLQWCGIQIDEGPNKEGLYGPYTQSERLEIYKEHVKILLNNDHAYPCFCTDRRLDLLRRDALRHRQVPKYDNHCRNLSLTERQKKLTRNEKHCIRFRLTPNCETFEDLIYGNIAYDVALQEGDPVIIKSDGYPTYHFANVVDDHLMEISHVLRGVEWQISTTKHILMYRAFNWDPPKYGHLPLLMNPDGSKLSKRQGDIKIESYRNNGIFPQALMNFVTTSGGGFDHNLSTSQNTCYSMNDLAAKFNISKISVSSGRLMPERLNDFNRVELKRQLESEQLKKSILEEAKTIIINKFPERFSDRSLQIEDEYICMILKWSLTRINRLEDIVSNQLAFLWIIPKVDEIRENVDVVQKLYKALNNEGHLLEPNNFKSFAKKFSLENNIPYSKFMKLVRSILSGLNEGPGVVEMIQILGRENTLKRIDSYLNNCSEVR